MTTLKIDVDEETVSEIVRAELMWFYDNSKGEISKKDRKAVKTTLMFFMTPNDIKETFGEKTYRKVFDEDE